MDPAARGLGAKALARTSVAVTDYGADPLGVTDSTTAIQAALTWLKGRCDAGFPARLVFPAGAYKVSAELQLPDAGGWVIEAQGQVTLTQQTDNKIIFSMLATAARSNWEIRGNFAFAWLNAQPATNTRAVAIALGSPLDNVDGLYDFYIGKITANGGFRCLSIHPDTVTGGYKCPIWGFVIESVRTFKTMTGASICLYSPNANVGAPRGEIRDFYCQGQAATEPRLRIENFAQLKIGNAEFNLGSGQQALFANCRQIIIDNLRLEQASTTVNFQNIFQFTGGLTQAVIRNVEIQTHTINVANEAYLINSDQGVVEVTNLITDGVTTTSGTLYMLNVTSGGAITYAGDWYRNAENTTYLHNVSSAPSIMPRGAFRVHLSQTGVGASANFTLIPNGQAVDGFILGQAAYLIGFYVTLANAVTAGTMTVFGLRNGASIGTGQYGATLNPGNGFGSRFHPAWKAFISAAPQDHKFAARDQASFNLQTSSDFLPINNTIRLVAVFAPVPR